MKKNDRFDFKHRDYEENAIEVLKDWTLYCNDSTGYLIIRRAIDMAIKLMEQYKALPELYTHYKGGEYELLFRGTHIESEEELVVYECQKTRKIWVRPAAMWDELVEVDGVMIPRFKRKEVSDEKMGV